MPRDVGKLSNFRKTHRLKDLCEPLPPESLKVHVDLSSQEGCVSHFVTIPDFSKPGPPTTEYPLGFGIELDISANC
eukprot:1157003-Pelagomonas_calceolata.AAC.7